MIGNAFQELPALYISARSAAGTLCGGPGIFGLEGLHALARMLDAVERDHFLHLPEIHTLLRRVRAGQGAPFDLWETLFPSTAARIAGYVVLSVTLDELAYAAHGDLVRAVAMSDEHKGRRLRERARRVYVERSEQIRPIRLWRRKVFAHTSAAVPEKGVDNLSMMATSLHSLRQPFFGATDLGIGGIDILKDDVPPNERLRPLTLAWLCPEMATHCREWSAELEHAACVLQSCSFTGLSRRFARLESVWCWRRRRRDLVRLGDGGHV